MENQQTSFKLGQYVNFSFKNKDSFCSCFTKQKTRCSNKHKVLFQLSNGVIYTSCAIPAHKKNIMTTFLVNGVTANVFKLMRYQHINADEEHCTYTVCGVDVDHTCNYHYPVIQKFDTITELKDSIQMNMNQHESDILACRYEIDNLQKYVTNLMKEMKDLKAGQLELSNALNYVRMNSVFNPSTKPLTE